MTTKRALPKHTIAKNLRAAMSYADVTSPQIAKIAGVDRKTVTNWRNGVYDPQPEKLDLVAQAMGFQGWMLMKDDFDPSKKVNTDKIQRLMELYDAADDQGKENILNVAEMAAHYHR